LASPIKDSLGKTCRKTFELNIAVARIVLTNYPPGTYSYKVNLYHDELTAATFPTPQTASYTEDNVTVRSGIAEIMLYGNSTPDKPYALLLSGKDGGCAGYFNEVEFSDGTATVSWYNVWHTFTDADSFKAFMANPDSGNNDDKHYKIALNGLDMTNELSKDGDCDLYRQLRSNCGYIFDFRGCTGETFTSAKEHTNPELVYGVYLGGDLTMIGDYAFDGCVNLKDVELPPNVKEIGNYAFNNCNNLSAITFPVLKKIERIGVSAFQNCAKIPTVDLSDAPALTIVDASAFYSSFTLQYQIYLL
jgi:hypothetical protein